MEDKLFLAWAAGFFDGEGCVLVSERNNHKVFQLFVSITQQDPAALHLLKQRFGGNVTPDKTAAKGYERKKGSILCWRWKSTSSVAYEFLKAIQPYVVVKADQVELALTWPCPNKKFNGVGIPDDVRETRRNIMYGLREIRNAKKVYLEAANGRA